MHSLVLTRYVSLAAARRDFYARFPTEWDDLFDDDPIPIPRGSRTPDNVLAQIAVWYEEALRRGSRAPIPHVAEQLRRHRMHRADQTVRALVQRARDKGFLTPTRKRLASGTATEKAHDTLKAD